MDARPPHKNATFQLEKLIFKVICAKRDANVLKVCIKFRF
jgi:hypothetical protein